jgi:hypothetical protein
MHERHNANRFLGLLAAGLAILSCSIICGAGCDFIEPGECLGPGELFGPCKAMKCRDGLTCLATIDGDICVPPESDAADDYVAECAYWRGTLGCNQNADQCYLQCHESSECRGGTVCSVEQERCVYPNDTSLAQV